MIALWETIWKSLWNKSVQHSDMDLYLHYLRRDEFQPTNYPDRIRSKVMQYVCDDWSIPLRANETNADIHNRTTQFETGNEINSCTSTAAAIHHFLCNRQATGYDVKRLAEMSGKKDFNQLPIDLQRMGPTLFIFYTMDHKFCILRVNEGISCIIHSNQDRFSQPNDYSRDPTFTLHEYLNPDQFPPCFIMDDHFGGSSLDNARRALSTDEPTKSIDDRRSSTDFVPKSRDVPAPIYSSDIEPLAVNVMSSTDEADRIRRFIQFGNDGELLEFFNDMKRTREAHTTCPAIYERYFGMKFKYGASTEDHWFIDVSLPPYQLK